MMKETEEKLQSKNPAYVSNTFSKIAAVIEKKQAQNDLPRHKHVELKFLEEKCSDQNAFIALNASKTLVKLIQNETLQRDKVLFDLISSLPLAKSYDGLCYAINEILLIDIQLNQITNFNLWSPQHPLVTLLHKNLESGVEVYNNMVESYRKYDRHSDLNDFYLPIYYYLFCNPRNESEASRMHFNFWTFLLKKRDNDNLNYLFNIISWFQFNNPKSLLNTVDLLLIFLDFQKAKNNIETVEVLLVILSSLQNDLLKYNLNPKILANVILENIKLLENSNTLNIILLNISKGLNKCPVNYLPHLLKLCEGILNCLDKYELPLRCLQVSLFNWIIFKSSFLENEEENMKKMIVLVEKKVDLINKNESMEKINFSSTLYKVNSSYSEVHIATEFFMLSTKLNVENIKLWVERFSLNTEDCILYLISLILFKSFGDTVINELVKILLPLIKKYSSYSTLLLTTILYKLSKTTDSNIHLVFFKTLPKLVECKENLPFIMHTLNSLKKSHNSNKVFVMELFFEMWKVDPKYYIYLQNLLNENSFDVDWEVNVIKSWIVKEICLERPELVGGELVSYLSTILNKCGNKNGALSSALAVEGISALCQAGIIDIYSTWKELSPRFRSEDRKRVLISVCKLLETVPMYFEESERYNDLLQEVTTNLWEFSLNTPHPEVSCAAYKALSSFKMEDITMNMPEKFHKNKSGALPGFGSVLNCENLLKSGNENNLDSIGFLLKKQIDLEVSEFRSGTYKASENGKEPTQYNYLSVYSVLRAVIEYVKNYVQLWNRDDVKPIYLQCLKVLSHEYKKPLPPLDWCFLQELLHFEEAKFYCISIASHQVRLSGTARRLMENVITALAMNETEECIHVYKNLRFLCDSIQPSILKPFLQNTIKFAIKSYEKNGKIFDSVNDCLKKTLSRNDIHEANRTVLSDIVVDLIKNEDPKSPRFDKLLETGAQLSQEYVSKFNLQDESEKTFILFLKIRVAKTLFAKENKFSWLKEVLNIEDCSPMEQTKILQELFVVIQKYKDDSSCKMWILDLMGQTQALLVENEITKNSLRFLCTVLIISFIIVSNHGIFSLEPLEIITNSELALRLFPQCVFAVTKIELWQKCGLQLLEWLHHMSNCNIIPESYQQVFYQAVSALRFEKDFGDKFNWMKFIDKKILYN